MNRPRTPDRSRGLRPGRMLTITAFIAVVFSVGMIVGQHLLFEESLPPVVSTSDAQPANVAAAESISTDEQGPSNLFSFYDVLTAADIQDDPGAGGERVLGDEAFAAIASAEPAVDSESAHIGETAFGIDDEQQPNTDDGSIPARYTLQIASHPTMEQARTEMDRLQAMDLDPHVVAAHVPEQGKYYRVRVGKYQNEDQARAFQARIEAEQGVRAIVTPL